MSGDGKPGEVATREWPSGLALRCLDTARALVGRATNTSILWSLALGFVWLAGLEPKARALDELKARKRAFANQQARQSYKRSSSAMLRRVPDQVDEPTVSQDPPLAPKSDAQSSSSEASSKETADNVSMPKGDAGLDSTARTKREQLGASQDSIARLKELANVSFQLPGVNGAIETVYAPLLWSIMLLGLIAYLYRARLEVLRLVVSALRSAGTAPEEARSSLLGDAPLWLAPVPSTSGDQPSRVDVERAIGWSMSHEQSTFLALAALSTTWLLQMRVVWLGFVVAESLGSDTFDTVLVPSLLVVVAVMTVGATIMWIRAELPGATTFGTDVVHVTRRRMMAKAALGAAAVVVFPAYRWVRASGRLSWWMPFGRSEPRFRTVSRDAPVQMSAGAWVRNTRSRVVHYVVRKPVASGPAEQQGFVSRCGGQVEGTSAILGVSFLSEKNLIASKAPALTSDADGRPNLATVSRSFESAALDVLQSNTRNGRVAADKLDEVFGLLLRGIEYDALRAGRAGRAPSYRLYDLAAALAVRYGHRGVIPSLEDAIRSGRYARPGHNSALASRLNKWKTSAAWKAKWIAPDQKWGCLVLPVAS